jgi:hypothetical protein
MTAFSLVPAEIVTLEPAPIPDLKADQAAVKAAALPRLRRPAVWLLRDRAKIGRDRENGAAPASEVFAGTTAAVSLEVFPLKDRR